MSRTVLTDVDGWTPVIDYMARDLGLITAAVFGRVWRYCQGYKGVCIASLETLSIDLNLDRATTMRHIKVLCEQGYLEDMTPDLRNKPHTYRDTGKAGLYLKIGTVAECNTQEERVAETNELLQSAMQPPQTVAESQLKKQFKIQEDTHSPLSAGQRKFLEYFGAKRYKTAIQKDTVGHLEKEHGTDKLIQVVEWQARQGMSLGHAVNSLENALKNWGKNGRASPEIKPPIEIPMPSLLCGDGDRLRRRAESASGQRNFQPLLQDYLSHLRSCRICSGGSNSNEIQTSISNLARSMTR